MLKIKNEYQQDLLSADGFFTTPFADVQTVEKISSIYYAHFSDNGTPFYSTSFHPDIVLKKKVNEEVIELLKDKIEDLFSDYKILGCSFLMKKGRENNQLPLHQDWTVCDEKKYGSYTVWIPLVDTNEQNGALRVIEGSHAIENNLRAPSIPVSFDSIRSQLGKHLKTILIKKGDAFVFNHKLMHASWQNQSEEERLVLTIGLVPKDAELFMLYYDSNTKKLSEYSMPDDLFLHYPQIINKPEIGTWKSTTDYIPEKLSEKDFLRKISEHKKLYSGMQPLFSDAGNQEFFEKNGYLLLPALEQEEISELKKYLYDSGIKKETDYGFYVGMDHDNKELVSKMMEKIAAIALPRLSPYLTNYQLITASYVIKDPNPKGVVPPHQDWTFVEDETKHCSITCWIALGDTNMQNGCMGVIKGSHKFFNSIRASPSPQVPSPLAKHMFSIFPYLELLPMKAGEALFFDNRTFHASPPNVTGNARLAVGLSFTQKEAELRHYYLKPGTTDTLLKYKITPDFFKKYDNGSLSKMYGQRKLITDYEMLNEVPYIWEDLSKREINKRIIEAGNVYNAALTNHMAKLFGAQMKTGIADKIKNVLRLPKRIFDKVVN